MSRVCDICGKRPLFGNNISHSHRKTRKKQIPNLHKTRRMVGGRKVALSVCTKCLRA
jgi:large subunit ribosomal protein L28